MTEELKPAPCPCCAWPSEVIHSPRCFDGVPGWRVRCDKCGLKTCWWHSREEAITAWNARPVSPLLSCINAALERRYQEGYEVAREDAAKVVQREIDLLQTVTELTEFGEGELVAAKSILEDIRALATPKEPQE